ncbi:uncharacterized protein LOC107001969 [Solanum pennellii]|uniref:Uncharacterized protein LOC107001969 n=1 Tax=Solanum pennellii TaxID=28526 RepID=A0ABM1UX89_SOLPN|nr:uncharacterized protein LOC107001969 [Solanum pennellii]
MFKELKVLKSDIFIKEFSSQLLNSVFINGLPTQLLIKENFHRRFLSSVFFIKGFPSQLLVKEVMAPSKKWMELVDKCLDEIYLVGVQKFLDYAFQKAGKEYEIRCPCVKCYNTTLATRKIMETHLIVYGIICNYTFWYHHGERLGEPLSELESESEDTLEDEDNN